MPLYDSPPPSESSDTVLIGRDDVSNYNPDNILPQSSDTIAGIRAWLRPTEYDIDSGEYRKHLALFLDDESVSVVHHSLTKFLVGRSQTTHPLAYPILASSPTRYGFALACLTYLCSGWLKDQDISIGDANEIRSRINFGFPLAAYAIGNWHLHAAKSEWNGLPDERISQKLEKFMSDDKTRNNWLRLYLRNWRHVKDEEQVTSLSGLHEAAICDLRSYILILIDRLGKDKVDASDIRKRTPLWWAAMDGHKNAARSLLNAGASPSTPDYDLYQPLHVAAMYSRDEVVQLLLEKGIDPMISRTEASPGPGGKPVPRKYTTVGYAASRGHATTVEVMLPFCDTFAKTLALPIAVKRHQPHLVNRLLEEPGLDSNEKFHDKTPLADGASAGDIESIEVLIEAEADVPQKTIWKHLNPLLLDHQYGIISKIFKAGADYTGVYTHGVSDLQRFVELVDDCWPSLMQILEPLLIAACRRSSPNMEFLRVLVKKKGIDINTPNSDGITALNVLAIGDHWWQVAQGIPHLISKGADLEARDDQGRTPLLYTFAHWEAFKVDANKFLIEHGADVNVVDSSGIGCLDKAAQDEELVRLSVSHGAEVHPTTISSAIESKKLDVLKILLRADISQESQVTFILSVAADVSNIASRSPPTAEE
ncbi:hypothetical protein F66182_3596 [Fusarium sp. NRRL 66182]|nr:hypothetical protein F66182_3596 [Fusarium sp. NRRL 66182]